MTDSGGNIMTSATSPTNTPEELGLEIRPQMDYDLPKIPFTFILTILNKTNGAIFIGNPLETIQIRALTSSNTVIKFPSMPPQILIHSLDSVGSPAPISFNSAIINEQVITKERDSYEIPSKSMLAIVFSCEPIVGERILEAIVNEQDKAVQISFYISLINLQNSTKSITFQSQPIYLNIPRPK